MNASCSSSLHRWVGKVTVLAKHLIWITSSFCPVELRVACLLSQKLGCNCDFYMDVRTNCRLTITLVGLHDFELLVLSFLIIRLCMCWWLTVRSAWSRVAYCWWRRRHSSRIILVCNCAAERLTRCIKWQTSMTWLLVFALISFVAAAGKGVFMSKNEDPQNFVVGLSALVPMPDCLVRQITTWVYLWSSTRRGLARLGICGVLSKARGRLVVGWALRAYHFLSWVPVKVDWLRK